MTPHTLRRPEICTGNISFSRSHLQLAAAAPLLLLLPLLPLLLLLLKDMNSEDGCLSTHQMSARRNVQKLQRLAASLKRPNKVIGTGGGAGGGASEHHTRGKSHGLTKAEKYHRPLGERQRTCGLTMTMHTTMHVVVSVLEFLIVSRVQ